MKQTMFATQNLTRAILFSLVIAVVSSCSTNEDVDPDKLKDTSGLNIDLEWTTGGSITQSLTDVDLDLKLMKGTTVVDESLHYSSFERVSLKDIYSDGEYTLVIEFEYGKKGADYTVFLNGIQSGTSKKYESQVAGSDVGATIDFLKIVKRGTEYSFSK